MTFSSIRRTAVLLAASAVLAAASAGAADSRGSKAARTPLPQVKITKEGEKCVEPTDIMRRRHMEFILHQRDDTMHRGIRTTRHSLKNCIDCHADPKTNSVLGEDGFCQNCHAYAAVSMDCFSCHTGKAEKQSAVSGLIPLASSADVSVRDMVMMSRLQTAEHNAQPSATGKSQ